MRLLPPPTPPKAPDPATAGEEARAEAVTRVSDHADPDWMQHALDAVLDLARTQEKVTSDDVWEVLDDIAVETHDNRAMGAVMTEAARQEWLHRTDVTVLSRRPINHRRPIRLWTSLIYEPSELVPRKLTVVPEEEEAPAREEEEARAEALDGEPPTPPPPRRRNTGVSVEQLRPPDTQISDEPEVLVELPGGITAAEVDDLPPEDGWSNRVEVAIETAATQISALRALSGQGRRRYWMMACPDHGYWLLTTGPKGLDAVSTWSGVCHTCRRAEAGDLVTEIVTPSYPQAPKASAEMVGEAHALVDGEAEAPEEAPAPEEARPRVTPPPPRRRG